MPISSPESRRRVALGLLVGLVIAGVGVGAGAASPALAHSVVVSSTPEEGETITEPIQSVSMTFSDNLITTANAVALMTVTDKDGGHHESGCVSVDGATMSTDVALGEAGEYTVTWRIVSIDGDPTSDTYTFDWQPSMPTAATTAMTSTPSCGQAWSGSAETTVPSLDATATATAAPVEPGTAPLASLPEPTMTILNATPAGQTDHSGLSAPLLIALIVGILAVLSAIVVVIMRRLRHS